MIFFFGAMIQKMKEMLRLLQKRRDSKINELLGTKEELEEVIEEIIEEKRDFIL
jgi:hypothetical protein